MGVEAANSTVLGSPPEGAEVLARPFASTTTLSPARFTCTARPAGATFFCSVPSHFTLSTAGPPSLPLNTMRSPAGVISRPPSSPGSRVSRRTRR